MLLSTNPCHCSSRECCNRTVENKRDARHLLVGTTHGHESNPSSLGRECGKSSPLLHAPPPPVPGEPEGGRVPSPGLPGCSSLRPSPAPLAPHTPTRCAAPPPARRGPSRLPSRRRPRPPHRKGREGAGAAREGAGAAREPQERGRAEGKGSGSRFRAPRSARPVPPETAPHCVKVPGSAAEKEGGFRGSTAAAGRPGAENRGVLDL